MCTSEVITITAPTFGNSSVEDRVDRNRQDCCQKNCEKLKIFNEYIMYTSKVTAIILLYN